LRPAPLPARARRAGAAAGRRDAQPPHRDARAGTAAGRGRPGRLPRPSPRGARRHRRRPARRRRRPSPRPGRRCSGHRRPVTDTGAAGYPAGGAMRRWTRLVVRKRSRTGIGELLSDVYTITLTVAVTVAMVAALARSQGLLRTSA